MNKQQQLEEQKKQGTLMLDINSRQQFCHRVGEEDEIYEIKIVGFENRGMKSLTGEQKEDSE